MPATTQLPTLQELLEAGVHFGHHRERSHPKARRYTFTIRDGVFIINLEQTVEYLKKAIEYLKKAISEKKMILLVGTKRQYQDLVAHVAQALDMPYVANKWLGGTLTNFDQLRKTAKKLGELESLLSPSTPSVSSNPSVLTKKERLLIERHIRELHQRYGGLEQLTRLPDLLLVIDPRYEQIAVKEAKLLEIPIMAILDTTSNPDNVDVVIPANDDSRQSVELILNTIVNGVKGSETRGTNGKREASKPRAKKTPKTVKKTTKKVKTQRSKGKTTA